MRFFAIAGLMATSVSAAAIAKEACSGTVTKTMTPAPVTATEEVYHNVYYTTSTVTRVALQSSAPAKNNAAAAASSPAPTSTSSSVATHKAKRACAAAKTETVTAEPSTTTVYETQTRTLAARETQTVAACQANNNFGLFKGTLAMRSSGGQLASTKTLDNMSTAEECCNACFTSPDGCMAWSFNGSVTNGDATQGCTMSVMSGGCPSSSGTQTQVYKNDEKALVGVGPCLVQQ